MRLSATRARFSLMPKRLVRRTSWATGSSGGSMPSSALARTDRAVSGVADRAGLAAGAWHAVAWHYVVASLD